MEPVKLRKNIYWVGAIDWNVRNFHGHTYTTNRGTTYNAYLLMDDKVTLIDAVYGPFTQELVDNIKKVISPDRIDYIVVNHVETDHSGALPELLKLCPKAKLFGTAKCKEGLYRHYYGDWDFQIVKSGELLELGKKTLSFIEAPMLHWPDSMFTYCKQEKILFPNDAFGQHYATSLRFDDEVNQAELMQEAAKYYANILWPLSSLVLRKIEELQKAGLQVEIIAPSHGVIWRRDSLKIINTYLSWAKNTVRPKVVMVYETMWGSTEKMARKIVEGLIDAGVEVKLFDIARSDRSDVVTEMLDAKGFIIGSSTHDNDMLLNLAAFLEMLKGLKPKNRVTAVFGSYGWAGGAVKEIEDVLKETGIEICQPSISCKYVPDKNDLGNCYDFGTQFAKKL